MKRRIVGLASGLVVAAMPLVAGAVENGTFEAADRSMPAGDMTVMLVTAAATVGLFLVAALGYMYRRERGLEWRFQQPDAPHDDHH